MRRRGKVDANHPQIVAALRACGASVISLAALGHGIPDILIGWKGMNYLGEIKNGLLVPSARRLTDDEEKFFLMWRGQRALVNSVAEALALIGMKGAL